MGLFQYLKGIFNFGNYKYIIDLTGANQSPSKAVMVC